MEIREALKEEGYVFEYGHGDGEDHIEVSSSAKMALHFCGTLRPAMRLSVPG